MAILSRFLQKIFGSTGGSSEFGYIGSQAAGNPQTTKDLALIQSLSQYSGGLYSIMAGAEPPRKEDFNSLFYLITSQLSYMFQSGIPEWISTENYYAAQSIVQRSGSIYIAYTGTSGTPNLNNDPLTTSAPATTINWVKLVDVAGAFNKKVSSEISALTEKTTLSDADVEVIEDSTASYEKKKVLKSTLKNYINTSIITSAVDVVIPDTVISGTTYVLNPNTASQRGKLRATLPVIANTIGKTITLIFGGAGNADGGLIDIYCNGGTSNLRYRDKLLSRFFIYQEGDTIKLRNDGVGWIMSGMTYFDTGYIRSNVWELRVDFGCSVVNYTAKNTSVDWIGQTITESISGTKGVIIMDSAPSGSSGYFVCYRVTEDGIFTNARTLTNGAGGTAIVNEGTGDNKNSQNNISHYQNLDPDYFELETWLSASASYDLGTLRIVPTRLETGTTIGFGYWYFKVDLNNISTRTIAGFLFYNYLGNPFTLTTQEYYYRHRIKFLC